MRSNSSGSGCAIASTVTHVMAFWCLELVVVRLTLLAMVVAFSEGCSLSAVTYLTDPYYHGDGSSSYCIIVVVVRLSSAYRLSSSSPLPFPSVNPSAVGQHPSPPHSPSCCQSVFLGSGSPPNSEESLLDSQPFLPFVRLSSPWSRSVRATSILMVWIYSACLSISHSLSPAASAQPFWLLSLVNSSLSSVAVWSSRKIACPHHNHYQRRRRRR